MLELRKLSKTFHLGGQTVKAVDNVSLKIDDGGFIAIMGSSGSGKTTLLNLMGGLDQATGGHIFYDDLALSQLKPAELARYRNKVVGFVFQSFNLLPIYTALENVMLPMIWSGRKRKERKERAQELLKMVGLGERMKFRPVQLSGGERQRVSIARALANEPKLVLADEPTGNLDSKTGDKIIDMLSQLNKELGVTVVMVTHDPRVGKRADGVVKMEDGRAAS